MRFYCCQMAIAWEDKARNFARVRELIAAADMEAGGVLLLPEMFATGFSMNVDAIAELPGGETERFLTALASATGTLVIGGLVRRGTDGKGRNCAVAVGGELPAAAVYEKMHPFSLAEESIHYAAGTSLRSVPAGDLQVGLSVCYDLRFPELYRHLARGGPAAGRAGATLMAVIANWPAAREAHWVTLLQARAIENQCYVAGCNRVGHDPQAAYAGRSLIVGPAGEVLADAGAEEGVISAEVDAGTVAKCREVFPALRDMRLDLLGGG